MSCARSMATHKILITGCRGQLGTDLAEFLKGDYIVHGVDVQDFDIREYDRVLICLKEIKPDVVLHTAAYTDVDGCETNRETATSINVSGTENIARACRRLMLAGRKISPAPAVRSGRR